jgi:anti-sigma factor RsiW
LSLSRDELLQLMAYADGELEDDEIPEVLALLEKSDAARRVVEQHSAVGEWLRASGNEHPVLARADDIATAVMDRIAGLGGAKVTTPGPRPKSARSRERLMAFGALCAAAAAVSLFYLWPPGSASRHSTQSDALTRSMATEPGAPSAASAAEPSPLGSGSGEPAVSARIAAAESEGEGIDVQAVESPHHPVSIFYMPAATGPNAHASSVVVWIGEE